MKDTEKNNKKEIINNKSWIILIISIFLIVAMVITISCILNKKHTKPVNSKENVEDKLLSQEDEVNLEDLTSITNKTEEELKKLNEKELEKETEKNKEKNKNTSNSKNKYYIKVNYNAQVVNVYTYDKDGKYTVPVKAFVCSTGTETPTSGVYKIPAKITWCHMFGDVYAHYCSQIVGNILFHSVPYLEKSNDTLEYWAYDKLGTKASMGCVRLTTRDAKWIFDNVPCGTEVEFYSSSNPGPLGKPSAQKISNAPGNLKNWDPTDPDPNNPWKTYKPVTDKKQNNTVTNSESKNNVTNTNTENNTTNNTQMNNEIENNIINNEVTNNTTQNEVDNNITNNESNNTVENEIVHNNDNEENNDINNIENSEM